MARLIIALAVLSGLLTVGTTWGASTPKNVQVNQPLAGPFPRNKQNEPSLAQNPTNAQNLVIGANDSIGEPPCTDTTPSSCVFAPGVSVSGFYASFDGGKSWPCQGLIDLSAFGSYVWRPVACLR